MANSSSSLLEYTLEDGAWKDSFDKLLSPKPILKELNILKKQVHASYNFDSSVENCSDKPNNNGCLELQSPADKMQRLMPPLEASHKTLLRGKRTGSSISTPLGRKSAPNKPFKCSISPITNWKCRYTTDVEATDAATKTLEQGFLQGTVIGNLSQTVVYDDTLPQLRAPDASPYELFGSRVPLFPRPSAAAPLRRVCFQPNLEQLLEQTTAVSKENTAAATADKRNTMPENATKLSSDAAEKLTVRPRRTTRSHLLKSGKRQKSSLYKLVEQTAAVTTAKATATAEEKRKTMPENTTNLAETTDKLTDSQRRTTSYLLKPGKWQKSLSKLRHERRITGKRSSANVPPQTIVEELEDSVVITAIGNIGCRKSIYIKADLSQSLEILNISHDEDWQQRVLQRCQPKSIINFTQRYTAKNMAKCKKIGEGAYGEVFTCNLNDASDITVLKIIPIAGTELINGEVQKSHEEMLSEIVISTELSDLRDKTERNKENATNGFAGVSRVTCVRGKYPTHLVRLWEQYDEAKGSENDHPRIFNKDQLYIVFELMYGGTDLEAFVFNNAEQSYYALQQIILTLAVGEQVFQFEHRDLHWGNILIAPTNEKQLHFKLEGKVVTLPTKGIKATIIDYTLSRMNFKGCCFYNDLSKDEELFTASGDYQFDIYRMMRDVLNNDWQKFEPKTNVFWISYLLDKMLKNVNYKSPHSKAHKTYINKLEELARNVLSLPSASECAKYLRKEL